MNINFAIIMVISVTKKTVIVKLLTLYDNCGVLSIDKSWKLYSLLI